MNSENEKTGEPPSFLPAESHENEPAPGIAKAEERLGRLAKIVGGDEGMSVRFGSLHGGNFFDPAENSITFDPQILLDGREYLAEFIAGHEGGHRAVTRSLEQIGLPAERARELSDQLGFGYWHNCLEDCADNRWTTAAWPKFDDDSRQVYGEMLARENIPLTPPVIDRMIARLGYVPKFVAFGSEIIRHWATGKYSSVTNPDVAAALTRTEAAASEYYTNIPGTLAPEKKRVESARGRFRTMYEKIWPEVDKLIEEDERQEALRQLAQEMPGASADGQPAKGRGETLPPELKKELAEKTAVNRQEQIDRLEKELAKLAEQAEAAGAQAAGDKSDRQTLKIQEEKEKIESGQANCVPWDKLSDELKQKITEIFERLPDSIKSRLKEAAKRQLEELDDQLILATRGKLNEKNNPLTHEEIKNIREAEKNKDNESAEEARRRQAEAAETERTRRALEASVESSLSEYDRIYKEIAPLADQLYTRISRIFLPQRHPRWQKGQATGQRLDLARAMQFEADRGQHDKLWERKTIPHKIDYRFTLLVDLSNSMSEQGKIDRAARGVILLAEVLNRLGIKAQILGFQDELIQYKNFYQELSPALRSRMMLMLREVENKGEHNQSRWNSDGYCLGEASKLHEARKGKDNFVVVLSDGLPVPDEAHAGSDFDLHRVVDGVRRRTKQKLIGIGLGQGTGHVSDFYPTALPNLSLEKLPAMLGDLLEDMINNPGRYR